MNLFGKGKGDAGPAAAKAPAFSPIDRGGLLGLLAQVVNTGQSGVLELHEPRGNWVYAFQAGALTHASGGRVRGARQAFDLLWEFQAGEFMFSPGVNPNLPGNLYIDKARLLDLLQRSQAVLQGPSAPYIPPGQQRPIAPVSRPYTPPNPSQMPPQWQPGVQPQAPGWPPAAQPQAPGWPGYAQQPGAYPPQGYPAAPQAPYPPAQPYPQQGYPPRPAGPQPQAQPMPPQAPAYPAYQQPPQQVPMAQPPLPAQQPIPAQPQMPPAMPQPPMPQQAPAMMPPQAYPQPQYAQPAPPQQYAAQPPPAPVRPTTPQSFSVPPMAIPRKAAPMPAYQPAPPPPAAQAPAPDPVKSKDDLAALRASLVAQAPAVKPAPTGAQWNVKKADGTVVPPAQAQGAAAKGKGKVKSKKGDSKLLAGIKIQLIKFLLWACERKYSPDDHWTLKDAFEVSTMELRDQFFSAFSQTLKSAQKPKGPEDELDDMTAGRMRGRGRRH